jgi:hypothetical protein
MDIFFGLMIHFFWISLLLYLSSAQPMLVYFSVGKTKFLYLSFQFLGNFSANSNQKMLLV